MNDQSRSESSESPDEGVARSEISRQRRLVDQAASMQSALRDWDRGLGTALVCTVLIASLIGVAFAFAAGGQTVSILGIHAQRTTWLGWLAVFTFAITLIQLVLDPRGAGRRRARTDWPSTGGSGTTQPALCSRHGLHTRDPEPAI
jgi:hypothetical protein